MTHALDPHRLATVEYALFEKLLFLKEFQTIDGAYKACGLRKQIIPMLESDIKPLIAQGFSLRQIAKVFETSPTNARYWIRKYGLELQQRPFGKGFVPQISSYKCGQCGETDASKFYGHKRKLCGPCHNAYNIKQGQLRRLKAIKELGGKCLVCGFDRYSCSLDIHHRDAKAKAPNFRSMRGWSWARILVELQKCILLCKNCHAAIHAGLLNV